MTPRTARRERAGRLVAIGAVVLLIPCGAVACGGTQQADRPAGPGDTRRAGVLRFWDALRRGSEARHAGDFVTAIAAYSEALQVDPRHEDALYYLGHCLSEGGRQPEARDAFARLLAVNPASARGQVALGAILAAPRDGTPPDLSEAETHFRLAHEINKEETGPMVRLGEIRLVQGDPEGAGFWLRSALATNPKSLEAAFLVGYLHWRTGNRIAGSKAILDAATAAPAAAPAARVIGEGDRIPSGPSPGGQAAPAARVIAPAVEQPLGAPLFGDRAVRARGSATPDAAPVDAADLEQVYRDLTRRLEAIRARAGIDPGRQAAGIGGAGRRP